MRIFKFKITNTVSALALIAMCFPPSIAVAAENETNIYHLKLMAQTFDGFKEFSNTQTSTVQRTRNGNQSYTLLDFGDGSVVIERQGEKLAASSFENTSGIEAEFLYNYDTKTLSGSNDSARYFNTHVRPYLNNSPALGSDSEWDKTVSLSALNVRGASGDQVKISLSRDYFTHDGKDYVLLHYQVPAFSYRTASGQEVVHWGEGITVTDPKFGEVYWNATLQRAVAEEADGSKRPYRLAKTMTATDNKGLPIFDPRKVDETRGYFVNFYGGEKMEVMGFHGSALKPDQSPILLAANLDVMALALVENSANPVPQLTGQYLNGKTGMKVRRQTAMNRPSSTRKTVQILPAGLQDDSNINELPTTGTGGVDAKGVFDNPELNGGSVYVEEPVHTVQGSSGTSWPTGESESSANSSSSNFRGPAGGKSPIKMSDFKNASGGSSGTTGTGSTSTGSAGGDNGAGTVGGTIGTVGQITGGLGGGTHIVRGGEFGDGASDLDNSIIVAGLVTNLLNDANAISNAANSYGKEFAFLMEEQKTLLRQYKNATNGMKDVGELSGDALRIFNQITVNTNRMVAGQSKIDGLTSQLRGFRAGLSKLPTAEAKKVLAAIADSKGAEFLGKITAGMDVLSIGSSIGSIGTAANSDLGSGELKLNRDYGTLASVGQLAFDLAAIAGDVSTGNMKGALLASAELATATAADLFIVVKGYRDTNRIVSNSYALAAELAKASTDQAYRKSEERTHEMEDVIHGSEVAIDELSDELDEYDLTPKTGNYDPRINQETGLPLPKTWAHWKKTDPERLRRMGIDPEAPVGGWPGGISPAQERTREIDIIRRQNEINREENAQRKAAFKEAFRIKYPQVDPKTIKKIRKKFPKSTVLSPEMLAEIKASQEELKKQEELDKKFKDYQASFLEKKKKKEDEKVEERKKRIQGDRYVDPDVIAAEKAKAKAEAEAKAEEERRLAEINSTLGGYQRNYLENKKKEEAEKEAERIKRIKDGGLDVTPIVTTELKVSPIVLHPPKYTPPKPAPIKHSEIPFSNSDDDDWTTGAKITSNDYDSMTGSGVYPPDLSEWAEWLATQNLRELKRLARTAGYPNLAAALRDWKNLIAKANDDGFRQWANSTPGFCSYTCAGMLGQWHLKASQLALGDILNDSREIFSTAGLSDVSISGFVLRYLLRDFGLEDGDNINIVISQFGRTIFETDLSLLNAGTNFEINLRPGVASIVITALDVGAISPNTAEIKLEDVVEGEATQTYSLLTGETATLRINPGRVGGGINQPTTNKTTSVTTKAPPIKPIRLSMADLSRRVLTGRLSGVSSSEGLEIFQTRGTTAFTVPNPVIVRPSARPVIQAPERRLRTEQMRRLNKFNALKSGEIQ